MVTMQPIIITVTINRAIPRGIFLPLSLLSGKLLGDAVTLLTVDGPVGEASILVVMVPAVVAMVSVTVVVQVAVLVGLTGEIQK